jgi:putative FmdB family regulatory protein
MPLYLYFCNKCKNECKIVHSIGSKEIIKCTKCGSCDDLERVYSSSFYVSEKSNIGNITKNFIEDAKQELKDQKKELKKKC